MARSTNDLGIDKDEDLFDFGDINRERGSSGSDELDVEQFLAAVGVAADDDHEERGPGVSETLLREVENLKRTIVTPSPKSSATAPVPSASTPPVPAYSTALAEIVGRRLPRHVWIAGLTLIGLNALVLCVVLLGPGRSANELEAARQRLEQAAASVEEGLRGEIQRFESGTAQAASAALESGVSLSHVERSLANRDFDLGRRQIYALLSTIDRLTPERRADLEARANFMLADSYRLEGEARLAEESKP